MPTVYPLLPDPIPAFLNASGDPASGWQLFVYEAGSSTKATSYRDSDGAVANTNPIILDSRGELPHGLYVENGTYKLVLTDDTDTDPPASPVRTRDNLSPSAAPGTTVTEWVDPSLTPTYVSGTQFTLVGDQTAEFHVGRRLRTTDTGGLEYPTISAVAFATVTTVTIADATIDSGLSKVEYSILSADNSAVPWMLADGDGLTMGTDAAFTLAKDPESALDGLPLRMLGPDFLRGLVLSNNATDPDHDVDVATGAAVDSTGAYGLALTSALTKQIDATFAAGTGAGGMFSGVSLTASTWYHVHLIRLDSDGTIDAGFDTSVTAANKPAGYTYYRRIGAVVTDASSNVVAFHQVKDVTYWKSPALDLDQAISSTATDYALDDANQGCPPDVSCEVWCNLYQSAAGITYIRSPITGFTDLTPSNSAAPLATIEGTGHAYAGPFLTSTARELNFRSTGTPNIRVAVVAYRDPR